MPWAPHLTLPINPLELAPAAVKEKAREIYGEVRFGISPEEIDAVAASWRAQGGAVGRIDLSALSAATGSGSDVVAALHSAHTSAIPTLESIATRLETLGNYMQRFNGSAAASDAAAAASMEQLQGR